MVQACPPEAALLAHWPEPLALRWPAGPWPSNTLGRCKLSERLKKPRPRQLQPQRLPPAWNEKTTGGAAAGLPGTKKLTVTPSTAAWVASARLEVTVAVSGGAVVT